MHTTDGSGRTDGAEGAPSGGPHEAKHARDAGRVGRRLRRALGQAIADFALIAEGDRILCAVSGGKDSFALHELLVELRARAPVTFEVVAVNVDQGQPGFPADVLPRYMAERGHDFVAVKEDTYSIVTDKVPQGKTYCSLCSRLRRAILYRVARERGCNKVALGHHRDDVLATLLMNLVFAGQLKAMPPKLVCDEGDIVVIRPLVYCAEADLAAFAAERAFPIIPCRLCGSQPNSERRAVGELLEALEARQPGARTNMLAALRNVRPSHLLDAGLWRALGLSVAADDPAPAPLPPPEAAAAPVLVPAARLAAGAPGAVVPATEDGGR
ncbi:MAG: tRNA 2-thiocytidine(32) synthetase TtcA [Myxococcales bacterium]|nr:tRNA 2-thiocytidine(32) synthetase TtcA [Myxococcales bacterium]